MKLTGTAWLVFALVIACKPAPQTETKAGFWETFASKESPDDPAQSPDWLEKESEVLERIFVDLKKEPEEKGSFNMRLDNLSRRLDQHVEKLVLAGNIPSDVGAQTRRQFTNVKVLSEKFANEFVAKKMTDDEFIESVSGLQNIIKLQGDRIAKSAKAKKRFFD